MSIATSIYCMSPLPLLITCIHCIDYELNKTFTIIHVYNEW